MVDVRNGGGEAGSFPSLAHSCPEPARDDDDENAQHSATASTAPPEDTAPSKAHSKASSRRSSPHTSAAADAASDLHEVAQPADDMPTTTEQQTQAQAQASSVTTSNSSHVIQKEPDDAAAAPYGTRSRNRPGRSRINYAEDSGEMDFEMAAATQNGNTSEPPSRGSVATDSGQSVGAIGKKGSSVGQGNAPPWGNAATPRDSPAPNVTMPSTSSSAEKSAINHAQPPKRRKNAASNVPNGNHTNAVAPSQSGPKRALANHAVQAVAVNNARESSMMTFGKSGAILRNGRLEADDGQTISVDDHVYLVCEPPGEPYYLCRVMEFIHVGGNPKARVEQLRVNWFYRPRDVQRYNNDTRLVYATMHSDLCPVTSLRGLCRITHRSEIANLDDYRKNKDSFWFNQLFDRFIHRWYDVIPTSQVINVPEKVKKALDERWKYICLETSRVKELTSAVKTCKRCVGFCASNDSVECAVCRNTYHMNCVRPPLLKKPSRGFAWACGPCSRAQEKKLEARRTPLLGSGNEEGEEEEVIDEEEEEQGGETTAPSPNDSDIQADLHPGTQAEIALAKMWPMRYLGIHCRVEDALQYDDRAIYPRASSRLGPRHQANVNVWHGRPVELVKPAEIKKRYVKAAGHKKDTKLSKETVAAMEADKAEKAKRPKWVMDEPPGYVRRGEDFTNKDSKCTAELMFKMPPLGVHSARGEDDAPAVTEEQIEAYMARAKTHAKDIGVEPWSTNFLDKCLALFTKHLYDADAALKQVKKLDRRKDLREPPELSKEEEKRWNEGVSKYGSEIRSVRLHTSKNMPYGDAVRYYYMWKKTPKGKEIWGSYTNRKGRNKKAEADMQTRLVDDVADDQDDSAFDNDKAIDRKRGFQCKFCCSRHSRQWRRAPNVAPGQTVAADGRASKSNSTGFVLALCQRCANLWRKYAVKWENTDEIAKKVAQGGGKAWKRRIDEELLREVYAAASEGGVANGTPEYVDAPAAVAQPVIDPPKKKQKTTSGTAVTADSGASTPISEPVPKKKEKPVPPPRAPTPPIIPAPPRLRGLPCAVCRSPEGPRLECAACRLTVHKSCYGIDEVRHPKWYCDTCKNDKKESVSYNYECVLCPHRDTEQDLYEPPKVSHKKKTDREREKERLEKELVDKARDEYRQKQQDKGRPLVPREPLKRTADNNWVHVHCALWIPETRFTSPNRLDMVEGVGAPTLRYDAICKLCKTNNGACVSCLQCHTSFHVGCAHDAGYTFGFDITPVKATRRDAVATVTLNGETGSMTAAIWCKDHAPKNVVHPMNEVVESTDLVALQLFAREFKQADLTLTGTARKANLVDQSTRTLPQNAVANQVGRRTSTITNLTPTSVKGRHSNTGLVKQEDSAEPAMLRADRQCSRCKIDVSPRWWRVEELMQMPQPIAPYAEATATAIKNGMEPNGTAGPEPNLQADNSQFPHVNGSSDHVMLDAPSARSPNQAVPAKGDADVSTMRHGSYLCQKCHWKKLNALDDSPKERESSVPELPEPQQPGLVSPPVQPEASVPPPPPPPQSLAAPWLPSNPSLPQHPSGPPLPWYSNGPPPHGPPAIHNSVAHNSMGHTPHPPPPGPQGPPLGPPPPFHSPYPPMHQSSGYTPFSGPPVHAPLPPASLRGYGPPPPSLTPAGGPPAPLHLNNGAIMLNGMHTNGMQSPRVPYSPTHAHGHNSSRSTESPFTAPPPPPMQYPPLHRGSPIPGQVRPSTPRDAIMRDAPASTAGPERATTGASASPSLRNLLH